MAESTSNISSRALLAAIVDSSDDAIISKGLDGIITSWNRGAQRIFGYTTEEAIGRSILMIIPPDRHGEETEIINQIRNGQRIEHFETVRQSKDGRQFPISVTISPVRDIRGNIVGASKIARDISPQHDMLDQLRRSEERFRLTLESIGDAVIATDKTGQVTFMNSLAEKLTGWTSAEAHGLPLDSIFRIINEFSRNPVENPVRVVLRKGLVVALANHTLLIARDGTERPIDDSGAPIREPNGEVSGVVLVFRDVSERRAAELAAQRLGAIIHSSDDAIIGKNLFGTITEWNIGAERIFGYKAEEIIGQSILTLIPPELQHEEKEILGRLRLGERISHFETTRMTKTGKPVQVSISVSPILDTEGHVIGASKIARDITERKKVEQALAEAHGKLQTHAVELEQRVEDRTGLLQKTIAELEAFSYSLSHDLRAPLRSITSFLEIVLQDHAGQVDPEGVELLQRVIRSARRMDRMILDLLAFARLSHTDMPIESVDVGQMIQGLIHESTDLQAPKAEVIIDGALPLVLGNEISLTQCISNLLDNAVKFVAAGVTPRVRIHADPIDGMSRIWFEDNGVGISPEAQEKLFQVFQRAHGSNYPGTGLGLAIVRRAIERMGGRVGFESEPGQGSRFWLELRRAD